MSRKKTKTEYQKYKEYFDNMYKEVVPDDQDELDKPVIKKQNKYAQVVEIGEYDDEL